MVVIEAMAMGTAVVATATEGAQEVVQDQKTGLLVPIGNVPRMAEAITTLLANPAERKQLGSSAQQAVATHFSLQRMVDEIEAIYNA